jgi:seryl-tRNA synthetase
MIDPDLIRKDPQSVKKNMIERYGPERSKIVDEWINTDQKRLKAISDLETLNQERNQLASQGKAGINVEQLRQKGKEIKEKQKSLEQALNTIVTEWTQQLNQIPNMHFSDVPIGKDDSANKVLREVGDKPKFDFEPKDHLTIGQNLGILDFETGAKVSGSQFYYLKNDGVMLEFALIQYGLEFFQKKGYSLVMTPDLAKSKYYLATGYAPRGEEAQIYEIEGEDLGLIATAEVTMAAMHADEILDEKDLPLKFAAISHCYRKEAGAYGKYSKGLYRVHQFSKLEMFVYCKPSDSEKIHKELLEIEEEIAQSLGIPYRVLEMCTGDLGGMAARKYDLEAWLPGRSDFGEITSTSNCTDYQARNLNIKYRNSEGKTEYLHMLNGTAIVMSRFPIAILENYQQADGSVKVPNALRKYFGKDYIGV